MAVMEQIRGLDGKFHVVYLVISKDTGDTVVVRRSFKDKNRIGSAWHQGVGRKTNNGFCRFLTEHGGVKNMNTTILGFFVNKESAMVFKDEFLGKCTA